MSGNQASFVLDDGKLFVPKKEKDFFEEQRINTGGELIGETAETDFVLCAALGVRR
ncbi:MAG: hypothetical protein ACOX41_01935 [Anaerovoracaceae bacterium]|jgi:hypothetical protein